MTKPRTIVATTAALLLSVTSSFAIDVGVGGVSVSAGEDGVSGSASVGGADVGASASTDGSVGAGASIGGASAGGEASSDGSVGGGASVGGASVGSSGPSGGGSGPSSSSSASSSSGAGGSSGTSDGASGGASGPSGSSSGSGGGAVSAGASARTRAAGIAAIRTPDVLPDRIILPPDLRPNGGGGILSRQEVASIPMQTIAGTSRQVIDACARTVAQAARPYGLVEVAAVSYGPARQLSDGGYRAPVFTRITYRRQGGYEVRQAPIWCHIDASGTVSDLGDIS